MPNDAELRRTGVSFTRAFTATAMCSPEPRELAHRQVPLAPRRDADADRGRPASPTPRTSPTCCAPSARLARSGDGQPRAGWRSAFIRGLLRLGPKSGNEPELRAGHRHARDAAARARLPRRVQGQVAPLQAAHGGELERRGPAADRARLRLRRLGAARRRRRRQGRALRRRQRGLHRTRAGTRTTRGRWSAGSRRPTCPSRSASSSRSSTRTTCSATRRPIEEGGYARGGVRRPGRRRSRRPSTRTCATSRRVHSLMQLGQTAYIGALNDERRKRDYVELLRLPAPRRGREDRPPARRARRSRTTRARCARAP